MDALMLIGEASAVLILAAAAYYEPERQVSLEKKKNLLKKRVLKIRNGNFYLPGFCLVSYSFYRMFNI